MSNYEITLIPLLSDNYSFIFKCTETNITACIDPADGPEIEKFINTQKIDFILNTHHHHDHIGGNK